MREGKTRVHTAIAPAAEPQPNVDRSPVAETASASTAAPAAEATEDKDRATWADALTLVAEECSASVPGPTPEEQWREMERIEARSTTTGEAAAGSVPPSVPEFAAA